MLRATAFALAMLGVFTVPAHATGLKATQTVEVVTVTTGANGDDILTFAPATDVEPGQQVRYSLTYTNEGPEPAESVSLVMPIPAEVSYVEASVAGVPGSITFSADNGQTYAARDALMTGDGENNRVANASEITHIKWAFSAPIAPADSGAISYMAVLK